MKIQHPLLIRAIGISGAALVRQLGRTLKYHFRFQDPKLDPEVARSTGQRYIYAFFHEVMLFPAYYWPWPEMHILISDHRDGELITQVIQRLGFTVRAIGCYTKVSLIDPERHLAQGTRTSPRRRAANHGESQPLDDLVINSPSR